MKGIDAVSEFNSATAASQTIDASTSDPSLTGVGKLEEFRNKFRQTFKPQKNTVLDEIVEEFTSTVDYCDNDAQKEVLKHHYLNEFGIPKDEEVVKDYRRDSIIHKVIDDMPSTYRGQTGAVDAWHDLTSYMKNGPWHFDLMHISVCRNHAQVYWVAKCTKSDRRILHGTDSFFFDDSNHIVFQTTVALSEKE